jgi:hypothetical protein
MLCFMPYMPKASTRQDVGNDGIPIAAMPKMKEMLVYHHNAFHALRRSSMWYIRPCSKEKSSKEIALQRARKCIEITTGFDQGLQS